MKILIIQTAFTGDVILATPVIEKLHRIFHEPTIDFLLRKGNESLFTGHPILNKVIVWDKKDDKTLNLLKIIKEIRKAKYDKVINIHRFASSGLITMLSGAKEKIGFDKNPFSFCYTRKVKHIIGSPLSPKGGSDLNESDFKAPLGVWGNSKHEVERNLELVVSSQLSVVSSSQFTKRPRLYPSLQDIEKVKEYQSSAYICIAPSSVWFTKQFPAHKWAEFLTSVGSGQWAVGSNLPFKVYLIGAESDAALCNQIINVSGNKNAVNLAGKLTFLQSAALMQYALMNYSNDSAPMHLASSVNAPVTAIFCSTIPGFGFGPLSDISYIVETDVKLSCKPCGLHGYKACPQKHFKCAETISVERLLEKIPGFYALFR